MRVKTLDHGLMQRNSIFCRNERQLCIIKIFTLGSLQIRTVSWPDFECNILRYVFLNYNYIDICVIIDNSFQYNIKHRLKFFNLKLKVMIFFYYYSILKWFFICISLKSWFGITQSDDIIVKAFNTFGNLKLLEHVF